VIKAKINNFKKSILYSLFIATNLFIEIAVKYNNFSYYHAIFISVYNICKIMYRICRKDLYPSIQWIVRTLRYFGNC